MANGLSCEREMLLSAEEININLGLLVGVDFWEEAESHFVLH